MSQEQTLQVTSIDKLKKLGKGIPVPLPGWDSEPFVALLRPVSINELIVNGDIPNELLVAAQRVFTNSKSTSKADAKTTAELIKFIAEKALVEPTIEQIREAGLILTDMQQTSIYNFTQFGPRALIPFNLLSENHEGNKTGEASQSKAE